MEKEFMLLVKKMVKHCFSNPNIHITNITFSSISVKSDKGVEASIYLETGYLNTCILLSKNNIDYDEFINADKAFDYIVNKL